MPNSDDSRNLLFIGALLGSVAVTIGVLSVLSPALRSKPKPDRPVEFAMTAAPASPLARTGPSAFDAPDSKPSPSAPPEAPVEAHTKPSPKPVEEPVSRSERPHKAPPPETDPAPESKPAPDRKPAVEPRTEPPPPPAQLPLKYSLVIQKNGGLIADGANEALSKELSLSATVHSQGPVPPGARIRIEWTTASKGGVSPVEFGPEGIGRVWEYNNKLWADIYTVTLKVDGQEWDSIRFTVK
ncbi:MAG: hypothetical protein U0Q16_25800 [Bryobacteraceae bacterium]